MSKLSQMVNRARQVLRRGRSPTDEVRVSKEGGAPDEGAAASPAVDVVEGRQELRIIADVPGAAPDSAAVFCGEDNVLVLRAAVADQDDDLPWAQAHLPQHWRRSFQLPDGFDGCRANARLRDGLLTISVPRREGAGAREIPVTVHS